MPKSKDTNTKVLVLSGSHGAGHVQAAKALVAHLRASEISATDRDILSFIPNWQASLTRTPYTVLTRYTPRLYGALYHVVKKPLLSQLLRALYRPLLTAHAKKIYQYFKTEAPTQIICTHMVAGELLDRLVDNGCDIPPYYTCITDYAYHPMWRHTHGSGYLVATTDVKKELLDSGIPENTIFVTGIPVAPAYSTLASKMDPSIGIVVLLGGYGLVDPTQKVHTLLKETSSNITIVCGKNKRLYKKISNTFATESRVQVYGWVDDMPKLLAKAERVVAKMGGLTATECYVLGVPIEPYKSIPGQEIGNLKVFEKRNLLWGQTGPKNTDGMPVFRVDTQCLPFL